MNTLLFIANNKKENIDQIKLNKIYKILNLIIYVLENEDKAFKKSCEEESRLIS